MFLASKLLSLVTQPLAWVIVLLLGALLCLPRRRRWGLGLGWAALTVLLLVGWEPLPDALLRRLENQHTGPGPTLQQYSGAVVLGGALEPSYVWQARQQPALNDAAERMTAAVTLVQQNPRLRLLFTGGEGAWFGQGLTEADRAKIFFDSLGLASSQVLYEAASRTTYENAVFSAQVTGVQRERPWLLLTSAWHMPRALATFRKAGWNVTAYPVDFRTGTQTPWTQYSLAQGTQKWQLALHEWVGLLAYRLAGRA